MRMTRLQSTVPETVYGHTADSKPANSKAANCKAANCKAANRKDLRRGDAVTSMGLTFWLILSLTMTGALLASAVPPPSDGTPSTGEAAATSSADDWHVLDPVLFPVPDELRPNVDFWTRVYAEYDNETVLLHDERHLQVIYAAIDLSQLDESPLTAVQKTRRRREEIRQVEAKYRSILEDLAAGRVSKSHSVEQARVEAMFASVPGEREKYRTAMDRMRTQTCLSNRFAEAVERSGAYIESFERIFAERGLPIELTRLPFVESLFQWHAKSSASAGGIWQFVPSTARLYLAMELEYDERFDPLRATEAAAQLLSENHAALETWPLAITAYNHGRYGMQRAVRRLGTRDLGRITEEYTSRTFGFASRNFYSEFIAAAQVYANRHHHFPGVEPSPALDMEIFVADRFVDVQQLAHHAEVDLESLVKLNPAFSRQIWSGDLYLPKSYALRVPSGQRQALEDAYGHLDAQYLSAHQVGFHHLVRPGDTLGKIAGKYGSSVRAVQQANRLSSPNRIRVGQKLLIPPSRSSSKTGRSPVQATAASTAGGTTHLGTYTVRPGDTLSSIARRFGTSAEALMATNGLASPDRLAVGQRLRLAGSSAEGSTATTHVVRSGETLASIARRYGISVKSLQQVNRISSHIIQPQQVLLIPR